MLTAALLLAVTAPADRHVFLDPGVGYLRSVGKDDGWFYTDVLAYRAWGPLIGGATLGAGGRLFGQQLYHVAPTLGAQWFPSDGLRVALLGELGVHHYVNVGAGLFSSGGPDASRGYAGARLVVAGFVGSRVSLGAAILYRNDLSRARVERRVVGEASLGAVAVCGIAW